MANMFTTTSNRSWFSRLGSSFSGILFGLGLIVVASILLFWNEGRAVKRDKALHEGAGLVLSVAADKIDKNNEKKLIHISGRAVVGGKITDEKFSISENAVRLKRKVEMLQWAEVTGSKTRNKLGGGTETVTTYTYELQWSARQIDSAKFRHPEGHENRPSIVIESKTVQSKNVKVGAFSLSSSQINRVGKSEPFALTYKNRPTGLTGATNVDVVNGIMFIGSQSHDRGGDIRVSFEKADPTEVTIVARQFGNSFSAYKTSNGGTISLLSAGARPADEMFQSAVDSNSTMTWMLRVVGIVMMFIGFKMVLGVLSVIGSVVPLVGRIVGAAVSLVSFLLALCLGLIIISIAWIFYRPLIGGILLALGIAAGYVAIKRGAKDEEPAPVAAE